MKSKITAVAIALLIGGCTTTSENKTINTSEDILLKENNIPLVITDIEAEKAKNDILTENGFESVNEINLSDEEKNDVLSNNIIHFDFNEYQLNKKSLKIIDLHVDFLKKNNTIKVIVEGHTDERGEKSYNLNLGEKRANAVKEYIVNQGVKVDRMEVISLGETMPIDKSSNKEAWNKNRRAVFIYN